MINNNEWRESNFEHCLFTGCTSGIGRDLAPLLVKKVDKITLIARSRDKVSNLSAELIKANPMIDIKIIILDLSNTSAVSDALDLHKEWLRSVDLFICNAGELTEQHEVNSIGLDRSFAVNFFAPALLISRLTGYRRDEKLFTLVVSSDAHFQGTLDANDLSDGSRFKPLRNYSNAKLGLTLFAQQHAINHSNPVLHHLVIVHPGIVASSLWPEATILHRAMFGILKIFMRSTSSAANIIYQIVVGPRATVHGNYYTPRGSKRTLAEQLDPGIVSVWKSAVESKCGSYNLLW